MQITLQTLTGTKYFLEVEPQDKVRKVKVKIFHDLEIKSKVHLMWQNERMQDGMTLVALGIMGEITIQMLTEPDTKMKVIVQTFKKGIIHVEVEDSSTILDFLEKDLAQSQGLLLDAHVSDFYFKDTNLSDDKLPFHLYGITDGSNIIQYYQGSFRLEIYDSRSMAHFKYITVQTADTIRQLKDKVFTAWSKTMEDTKCQLHEDDINFVIFINRKGQTSYDELDRDSWTVSECKLRPLDTVHFIRSAGSDHMVNAIYNGEKRQLHGINSCESGYSLRLKIQNQLLIPFEKQQLFFNDSGQGLKQIGLDENVFSKNILIKTED